MNNSLLSTVKRYDIYKRVYKYFESRKRYDVIMAAIEKATDEKGSYLKIIPQHHFSEADKECNELVYDLIYEILQDILDAFLQESIINLLKNRVRDLSKAILAEVGEIKFFIEEE